MNDQLTNDSTARRAGSPERSAGLPARSSAPDPEVAARPTRRQIGAEYKARIVREADACTKPGEVGALLRREGLYSSILTARRRGLRVHGVESVAAKRRGPAPNPKPSAREIELERANRELQKKLAKAEAIIEFQKKCTRSRGSP